MWSGFYTEQAVVPIVHRFDYADETALLTQLCSQLVAAPESSQTALKTIQYVSDEYALESPLTPPTSMFGAVAAGAVGETFNATGFSVCRCRRCAPVPPTGWLRGRCGERVLPSNPYKFIHVNLSRKMSTVADFDEKMKPVFQEHNLPYRMLPGDSGLTLALVALDAKEERALRRLLRKPKLMIDLGIRIFHRTENLLGTQTAPHPPAMGDTRRYSDQAPRDQRPRVQDDEVLLRRRTDTGAGRDDEVIRRRTDTGAGRDDEVIGRRTDTGAGRDDEVIKRRRTDDRPEDRRKYRGRY